MVQSIAIDLSKVEVEEIKKIENVLNSSLKEIKHTKLSSETIPLYLDVRLTRQLLAILDDSKTQKQRRLKEELANKGRLTLLELARSSGKLPPEEVEFIYDPPPSAPLVRRVTYTPVISEDAYRYPEPLAQKLQVATVEKPRFSIGKKLKHMMNIPSRETKLIKQLEISTLGKLADKLPRTSPFSKRKYLTRASHDGTSLNDKSDDTSSTERDGGSVSPTLSLPEKTRYSTLESTGELFFMSIRIRGRIKISLLYYTAGQLSHSKGLDVLKRRKTSILSKQDYERSVGNVTYKSKNDDCGEFRVIVEEAELCHTDNKKHGLYNSYVKCYLLPDDLHVTKMKSRVVKKSLNPHWKHTFCLQKFSSTDLSYHAIELMVFCEHNITRECVGGIRLSEGLDVSTKEYPWLECTEQESKLFKSALDNPGEKQTSWIDIRNLQNSINVTSRKENHAGWRHHLATTEEETHLFKDSPSHEEQQLRAISA